MDDASFCLMASQNDIHLHALWLLLIFNGNYVSKFTVLESLSSLFLLIILYWTLDSAVSELCSFFIAVLTRSARCTCKFVIVVPQNSDALDFTISKHLQSGKDVNRNVVEAFPRYFRTYQTLPPSTVLLLSMNLYCRLTFMFGCELFPRCKHPK